MYDGIKAELRAAETSEDLPSTNTWCLTLAIQALRRFHQAGRGVNIDMAKKSVTSVQSHLAYDKLTVAVSGFVCFLSFCITN